MGKGRNMGLNQISLAEARVATGNGEQTMSRDIYRLGQGVDFFRMCSVYYTTIGPYVNALVCSFCFSLLLSLFLCKSFQAVTMLSLQST